jgi:hypothetical protein
VSVPHVKIRCRQNSRFPSASSGQALTGLAARFGMTSVGRVRQLGRLTRVAWVPSTSSGQALRRESLAWRVTPLPQDDKSKGTDRVCRERRRMECPFHGGKVPTLHTTLGTCLAGPSSGISILRLSCRSLLRGSRCGLTLLWFPGLLVSVQT